MNRLNGLYIKVEDDIHAYLIQDKAKGVICASSNAAPEEKYIWSLYGI